MKSEILNFIKFKFQIIFLILTPFVLSLDGLTNYSTEDGNERTEVLDNEGNVRGQYSYNGPHGKRIKVKYTAGKKGFQVKSKFNFNYFSFIKTTKS